MRNGGVFLSCYQQRLSAPTKLPESLCEKKGDGARYWRLMSQRSNRWECRKRDKPQKPSRGIRGGFLAYIRMSIEDGCRNSFRAIHKPMCDRNDKPFAALGRRAAAS